MRSNAILRTVTLLGWVVAIAGLSASCVHRHQTYRYRLTLNVEVNGVLKSNSSVVEVTPGTQQTIDGESSFTDVRGQATVVDLGDGRAVVALLDRIANDQAFYENYDLDRAWKLDPQIAIEHAYYHLDYKDIPVNAPPEPVSGEYAPSLVLFSNKSDPLTARQINPNKQEDALGEGTSIVSVTVQIVSDEVSTGITQELPWLSKVENYINGAFACESVCYRHADFAIGVT